MKVTVSRKAHFNAAHRLYVKNWSDKKNEDIFGKCNNPNYHGHNYELIVSLTGDIDPISGMVIDLKDLKDIIKSEVEEVLDHKNLNLDVEYFKNVIPSVENICVFIWGILRKKIDNDKLIEVTLYETPRNFVKYSGDLEK
jgi:6-pyruvoyltetrahydropterin/6-carboxytetrahydropterin synthase